MPSTVSEIDWQQFKAEQTEPNQPECPFCGIHHKPGKSHPYCDKATAFKFWLAAKKG